MNDKERKKLIKWYQDGKPYKERRLNLLVEAHKDLVYKVANRFTRNNDDVDDLFQEGTIGLIKGVRNFKPTRKALAFTYLAKSIEGSIRDFLRKNYPYIEIREKTDVEVRHLNHGMKQCKKIEVRTFEKIKRTPRTILIDTPDEGKDSFFDKLEAHNNFEAMEENQDLESKKVLLRSFVAELKPRERKVYYARFVDGKTLDEIGKKFGFTRERTRQIEEKIIYKLKAKKVMHDIKRNRK